MAILVAIITKNVTCLTILCKVIDPTTLVTNNLSVSGVHTRLTWNTIIVIVVVVIVAAATATTTFSRLWRLSTMFSYMTLIYIYI